MNEIISLDSPPNTDEGSQRSIDGIIGIIHLISGPYLIVITSKLRVGNIHGRAMYKIPTTDFVPFVSSTEMASSGAERSGAGDKNDWSGSGAGAGTFFPLY